MQRSILRSYVSPTPGFKPQRTRASERAPLASSYENQQRLCWETREDFSVRLRKNNNKEKNEEAGSETR